jgi:hypothetical protein
MTKLVVEAVLITLAPFLFFAAVRAIRVSTSSDPKDFLPSREPVSAVRRRTLEV